MVTTTCTPQLPDLTMREVCYLEDALMVFMHGIDPGYRSQDPRLPELQRLLDKIMRVTGTSGAPA